MYIIEWYHPVTDTAGYKIVNDRRQVAQQLLEELWLSGYDAEIVEEVCGDIEETDMAIEDTPPLSRSS